MIVIYFQLDLLLEKNKLSCQHAELKLKLNYDS